jgi:hypothetical protein
LGDSHYLVRMWTGWQVTRSEKDPSLSCSGRHIVIR